jgi:UDP-N-acetylmuramoylalanine--D-glutamate ligase
LKIRGIINLFLEKARGKVVGITGTKGKSTVTTLIYFILKQANLEAILVGNIGIADLEILETDNPNRIYVYEMSSYMCQMLDNISPEIAVFTSFYPDHLDFHHSLQAYFEAKQKITKFQKPEDFLVTTETLAKELTTQAKKIEIDSEENLSHFETKLKGQHNQLNCNLAYHVCKILGLNEDLILECIKNYQPLPGRLELIKKANGIEFYEDALATIPEATWLAIQALEKVDTIILGGLDRGLDFEEFAQKLATSQIRNFIIFPENGQKMVKNIPKNQVFEAKNMQQAVEIAFKKTKGICLLSTASPSYNMFKNYQDRSNQYKYWIEKLAD